MQCKKFGGKYVFRIDKGEEIVSSMTQVLDNDGIKAGVVVSGIGGVDKVVLRFFDLKTKKYVDKEFVGQFEMTTLSGNISELDGKSFLHLHITLGDSDYNVFGGHLGSATVGITSEIIVNTFSRKVAGTSEKTAGIARKLNPGLGINEIDLS